VEIIDGGSVIRCFPLASLALNSISHSIIKKKKCST